MAKKQLSLISIYRKYLRSRWKTARDALVAWPTRRATKENRERPVGSATPREQILKVPKQWQSKYGKTLQGYLVLDVHNRWKMEVNGYYTSRQMSDFGFSESQITNLVGRPNDHAIFNNADDERVYVDLYRRDIVDFLFKPQSVGSYKVRLVGGNSSLVLKVDGCFTEPEVVTKGFTRKEISKYIGDPDGLVTLHGIENKVYTPKQVDAALLSPDFLAAKSKRLENNAKNREKSAKRREAAEAARIAALEVFEGDVYAVTLSYKYGTETYALLAANPEDAKNRALARMTVDNHAQQLFESAVADYMDTMKDYRKEVKELKRDFGPSWDWDDNSDIIPVKPVKPKRAEFNLIVSEVSVYDMPRNELFSVDDVKYVDETGGWEFDIYPDKRSRE